MSKENLKFGVEGFDKEGKPMGPINKIFDTRGQIAEWIQDMREKGIFDEFTFKRIDLTPETLDSFKDQVFPGWRTIAQIVKKHRI